jgi:hypothetical protein
MLLACFNAPCVANDVWRVLTSARVHEAELPALKPCPHDLYRHAPMNNLSHALSRRVLELGEAVEASCRHGSSGFHRSYGATPAG